MALVVLTVCLVLPVSAEGEPAFSLSQAVAVSGSTATVTVSVDTSVYEVSGLRFYLAYDPTKIVFENKSTKIFQSDISKAETNKGNAENGKIYFTYVGSVSSPIKIKTGKIASFDFTVVTAETGTVPIELVIEDFYNKKLKQIEVSSKRVSGGIQVTAGAAAEVEALISAIGDVSYPQSNDAILAARKAYNRLSAAEKKAVKNADVLADAESQYNKLKIEYENAAAKSAADAFRQEYAQILSKKPAYEGDGALTLSDKDVIDRAIESYNSLASAARMRLNDEINHLNTLKNYLPILESIAQAEDTWKIFNDNYSYYYGLTVDNVTTGDLMGLGQAKQLIDNMRSTFDDISDWVEKKTGATYVHIKALYDKAVELNMYENAESTKEYLSFMDEYGKWLTANKSDVTKDDEVTLSLAKQAYELVSDEAKALIGENFYNHICELLDAAKDMDYETDTDIETVTVTETVTDTVYVDRIKNAQSNEDAKTNGKTLVRVSLDKASNVFWILLISLGTLLIILAAATVMQVLLRRKFKTELSLLSGEEVKEI